MASTGTWAGGSEINLWFGQKNLDLKSQTSDFESEFSGDGRIGSDSFSDLEDLGQIGLMTSWGLDWPVAIAADLFYGTSDVKLAYTYSYYYYGPSGRGAPYYSVTERIDIDYTALELDLGIRKYWGGKVQFLLGTGLAIASVDVEANGVEQFAFGIPARGTPPSQTFSESDSGSDFGLWADIGFVWRAGNHFNFGLDVRYSSVNVDLTFDDEDGDLVRFPVGGLQAGLFIGGRW